MPEVVEFDAGTMSAAADASARHALRDYDAVQCVSALRIAGSEVAAVAGDRSLLDAWKAEGLAVADSNQV